MLIEGKVSVVLSTAHMLYPGVYQPSLIWLADYILQKVDQE
jgi:hypothetical protein